MVSIEVNEFVRPTPQWFVLEYLFSKGEGNRLRGEAYGAEIYRAWEQLCIKIGRKCGTADTFYRTLQRMKSNGIIMVSRTKQFRKGQIPRSYYVLDPYYFEELRKEKVK